jgi:hypothetical protein
MHLAEDVFIDLPQIRLGVLVGDVLIATVKKAPS